MHIKEEYLLPSGTQRIKMSSYITADGALPEESEMAEKVIDSLICRFAEAHENRIELDFSDVNEVSEPFLEELYCRASQVFPGIWLIPRDYQPRIRSHLHEHLYGLQQQRTEAWRIASEFAID